MTKRASLDRAFAALADGTRRGVVERLRRGPARAGELAQALRVSAPALSRHLRLLRACKLVAEDVDAADARARVYTLRREVFVELRHWVDDVEAMWQDQLAAFAAHVQRRTRQDP